MKTLIFLFTLWLLSVEFVSGQVPSIDKLKTELVTENTGFSFKLHSDILNEDRTIFIALPVGYDSLTKKYPVLYMMDAQWNFSHTAQTMAWLSRCYSRTIPHTIVVGVHTGDNRYRDLTPTQNKDNPGSGGADKFYEFLTKELFHLLKRTTVHIITEFLEEFR